MSITKVKLEERLAGYRKQEEYALLNYHRVQAARITIEALLAELEAGEPAEPAGPPPAKESPS